MVISQKRNKEAGEGKDFWVHMLVNFCFSFFFFVCIWISFMLSVPESTVGSKISLQVQRSMKQRYRKSQAISKKYYELYQDAVKNKTKGNVIKKLADVQGISPALFARSLLQHLYPDSDVSNYLRDTTLMKDMKLSLHVFLATMSDNQYGLHVDNIRQSVGMEYEIRIERELKIMNIIFSDENVLRSRGYDKTPDFQLDVPIAVDGFVVNWIESKALFGDEENHNEYTKEQLTPYWNRFGPGLVIYWFGYLESLETRPQVNTMFIIRSKFPDKESITQCKVDV